VVFQADVMMPSLNQRTSLNRLRKDLQNFGAGRQLLEHLFEPKIETISPSTGQSI
jgi:hypothetical protein